MTSDGIGSANSGEFSDRAEQALLPVPDNQRTSKVSHQFWIWAGANIAPINWVLGALGIKLGLSLNDVMLALVLGNAIGMVFFGFFVLMGQSTGVTGPTCRPLSKASSRRDGAQSTPGSCSICAWRCSATWA